MAATIDLSSMNDAQRRIAQTLDKPLFVEAGAGSGKTFTLTLRIAWALAPGSGPDGKPYLDSLDQVLVITLPKQQRVKLKSVFALRCAGSECMKLRFPLMILGSRLFMPCAAAF